MDLEDGIKCSNYVGEALDMATVLGFPRVLLVGHIGKFAKLSAGIMNTHSRMADARGGSISLGSCPPCCRKEEGKTRSGPEN